MDCFIQGLQEECTVERKLWEEREEVELWQSIDPKRDSVLLRSWRMLKYECRFPNCLHRNLPPGNNLQLTDIVYTRLALVQHHVSCVSTCQQGDGLGRMIPGQQGGHWGGSLGCLWFLCSLSCVTEQDCVTWPLVTTYGHRLHVLFWLWL